MSSITIRTWMNQEANSFSQFTDFVATRLESAILHAIVYTLRKKLKDGVKAEVELPWGTFSAETKEFGGTINIAPSWEPSKAFMKSLNGDDDRNMIFQDTFDEYFEKEFKCFAKYGKTLDEAPEDDTKIPIAQKGIELDDGMVSYLLNSYAHMLATVAKDKQHNGKVFVLEVNNEFPHGSYNFEYEDNEIVVKFVPDKVFKQLLKDDEAAEIARTKDFSQIEEGTTRKEISAVKDMNPMEDTTA